MNIIPEISARITLPAAEALALAGNGISPPESGGLRIISLHRPPAGLVVETLASGHVALRMADEPPWSDAVPTAPTSWDARGTFVACPSCGAALVWDEAGRVPGARLCLSGHRLQLSSDGAHAAQESADL